MMEVRAEGVHLSAQAAGPSTQSASTVANPSSEVALRGWRPRRSRVQFSRRRQAGAGQDPLPWRPVPTRDRDVSHVSGVMVSHAFVRTSRLPGTRSVSTCRVPPSSPWREAARQRQGAR